MRLHSAAFFLLVSATVRAQDAGTIARLSPEIDQVIPANGRIEKLGGDFGFIEGPVWIHAGYLLFSDIPNNVINKWTPDGKIVVFRKASGYSGTEPLAVRLIGSNGLTLDKQGRLIICQHGNRRIVRVDKDGKETVLADKYEGKRLNSPNDAVFRSDGSLYFTDPPYGLEGDDDPLKELKFNGIFRLAHGKLQLLYSDLSRPNGIAISPDEKYLYIANSDEKKRIWMRFDLKPDGGIENGKIFYDAMNDPVLGQPDGMKVDTKGNLYCTGPGGVWIFSQDGKHLGTIQPTEKPANCGWGGNDGRTLFMTARTGLYSIRLNIPGVRP